MNSEPKTVTSTNQFDIGDVDGDGAGRRPQHEPGGDGDDVDHGDVLEPRAVEHRHDDVHGDHGARSASARSGGDDRAPARSGSCRRPWPCRPARCRRRSGGSASSGGCGRPRRRGRRSRSRCRWRRGRRRRRRAACGRGRGQSSSTPAAPGAANTRMFFSHCRGRAVRTSPWASARRHGRRLRGQRVRAPTRRDRRRPAARGRRASRRRPRPRRPPARRGARRARRGGGAPSPARGSCRRRSVAGAAAVGVDDELGGQRRRRRRGARRAAGGRRRTRPTRARPRGRRSRCQRRRATVSGRSQRRARCASANAAAGRLDLADGRPVNTARAATAFRASRSAPDAAPARRGGAAERQAGGQPAPCRRPGAGTARRSPASSPCRRRRTRRRPRRSRARGRPATRPTIVAGRRPSGRHRSRRPEDGGPGRPEVRPALRHDVGIGDHDAGDGGAEHAEGHGQAVVVVGGQHGAVEARAPGRCAARRARRSTRAPVLPSSAARSPRRSLSLARMKPTPVIVVGDAAVDGDRGQRRDEVGDVGHVDVDPPQRHAAVALDDRARPASSVTVQPIRPSRSANTASPWAERRRRPVTCTRPPATAAMASG